METRTGAELAREYRKHGSVDIRNTAERIRLAMELNEQDLLARIRQANRKGLAYQHPIYGDRSTAQYNAENRLEERGVIIFNRRGSWRNPRRGWWLTSLWLKENR